jgi:hypothetical protein
MENAWQILTYRSSVCIARKRSGCGCHALISPIWSLVDQIFPGACGQQAPQASLNLGSQWQSPNVLNYGGKSV